MGVRSSVLSERDSSWHAAQQSRSMRAKLPKRQPVSPPTERADALESPVGPEIPEMSAFDEISAVLDDDTRLEEEAKQGRLNQNQLLDIFHLRREDPDFWNAEQLCERYNVPEEDVRDLLRYSRTVLAKEVYGMSRGVADPKRGILRFEDQQ